MARPTIAPYTASKGGLKLLTQGMATDWGKHNIQVNGIAPGYFKTELTKPLYEDKKFDAVLSNAVIEHASDLETFFRETARVTKPGGMSYHLYHNYYSLSGGHLPESVYRKVPWGHLRGK